MNCPVSQLTLEARVVKWHKANNSLTDVTRKLSEANKFCASFFSVILLVCPISDEKIRSKRGQGSSCGEGLPGACRRTSSLETQLKNFAGFLLASRLQLTFTFLFIFCNQPYCIQYFSCIINLSVIQQRLKLLSTPRTRFVESQLAGFFSARWGFQPNYVYLVQLLHLCK